MTASATLTKPGAADRPLSPSQVLKFLHCSAAWEYRYIQQIEETPTASLALGKALHSAAAASLRAKMDGETLPAELVMVEILAPELERELAAAELEDDEHPLELAHLANALYAEWHRAALPITEPAAVEVPVSGTIAGVHVRGIVDLITTDGKIADLKTASRTPTEISPAHAFQLTTYAHIQGADRIRVDTITKAKTPRYVAHSATLTPEDHRHVETVYPAVAAAMAAGFTVPNRASTFCARRNCCYWRQCEADYGGRVKD